jgi:hypothetical protein
MGTVSLFGSSNSLYDSSLHGTQATQQAQQAATEQQDSVKLSETAQAKLLYKQGDGVSTIASALGTTTKEIDNDLGLTLEKELEQTLQATLSAKS